ncbi:MAG TPA: hypothetical protein VF841_17310 [Anaeromyxobacter sp.]
MANHGRTGEALAAYRRRKARPHVVSGQFASDGSSSKPQVLSRDEYKVKLRLRGTGRGGRKGKDGAAASKSSGGIVHWHPVVCRGRS